VAGYTLKTTLADELTQRNKGLAVMQQPLGPPPDQVPSDFRILVAEDNSISTKVIRGMLGKLNLQPDTASNGEEALQAMKAQRYDLVLMDCEMPVLDGFSATQQLRAWEVGNQRTHARGGADRASRRAQGARAPGRHGRAHGQAGGIVAVARADRTLGCPA
jgi:CheY-like chemotaxis protein